MLNAGSHKGQGGRKREIREARAEATEQESVGRPRWPTVRAELLFQTGAPELVVQKLELLPLDGRCCKNQEGKSDQIEDL